MLRWVRSVAWYRVAPLGLLIVFGIVSAVYSFAPAAVFSSAYPLNYEVYIKRSSEVHNVDPFLVCAMINTESSWSTTAESRRGACGLMQVLPSTASDMVDLGLVDSHEYYASELDDPATNIEFGCAYLSYLVTYFHGSTDRAVAAYNAGMGKVNVWAQEDTTLHNAITYPETQAYLFRVNTARARYADLYSDRFAD